jgi:hypothetical protein
MSLAAFDISKFVENGVEITPEIDPSSGLIRYVAYLDTITVLWTYTLAATPSPLSTQSRLALREPLCSFSKILDKHC